MQSSRIMPIGEALLLADHHRSEGRLAEAEALCRQVLAARPDSAEAEHLLGVMAHQNGKLADAIAHVRRAVAMAPKVALFHANLGEMLRLSGQPKLAVDEAKRALAIEPAMPAALSNLGVAFHELKAYDRSASMHRKAIAAQPDFAEAHSNLGNALHGLKQYDEAARAYRQALALRPDFADAWANLGTTLHHGGAFDEAVVALRHAIALVPDHANARSGLGMLLLMRGDLADGWAEYEFRLLSSERKGPRFPENPWTGGSLVGKHIYVQAEQGFGDTLQFIRYIPLLAARAAKVSVRVHQQLVALLRINLPGVEVLGDRGNPAPYDCDGVLMSLPYLFRTRLETIPAATPYLHAPADIVTRWGKRLAGMAGLKVGLVWGGNPDHVNDTRRSIALQMLAPLMALAGVSFASLQIGPKSDELKKAKAFKGRVLDLSREVDTFVETAGAAANLDLIITVDTSLAHLCGALGRPVWVLLPWVTDWRWLLDRDDNPWYPSMRCFRQKPGEDWAAVVPHVVSALQALVAGDRGQATPFKALGERRAAQAAAIIAVDAAHATSAAAGPRALTSAQLLMLAEQKRRQGFHRDAEDLCRRALAAEPGNADAHHMLGILAHQAGKLMEAIDHVRQAVAAQPDIPLFYANLGEMCRLAGRTDEAIVAGRLALELKPDYPDAASNLGIALFDQDKFDEALTCYDRAIALNPDFVQAHSNRGNVLQRLKRFPEAEQAYRKALDLDPTFTDGWNNLGTVLRELKQTELAEAAYRRALDLKPNDPDILDSLSLAVKDLGRLDEAAEILKQALAIEQLSDKIHLHHGVVLLDLDRIDEAAAAAGRAVALNPTSHDAINLLGRIAHGRGDTPAALAHFQHALALKPDLADAYNNRGNVLKEVGRVEEAKQAYLQALALDPAMAGVYVNLVDSVKIQPHDPLLQAMETLVARSDGLSASDRLQLDFALGKAYADLKDHERAFKHLLAGNAMKRSKVVYDEREAFAFFDAIERVFTPALIGAKSGGGHPDRAPIFILGMPRSGTTLVEQILASHPAVHGAGELQLFNDAVQSLETSDGTPMAYPAFTSALHASALHAIGARYLASLRALAPFGARVTDKMPSNYYFAGLIHLALPNATIIHTIRDPVDTCVSCFSKLFTTGQVHTYDLAELGRYYKRYERLMAHWRRVLPSGRILDVRYEDVVADLEGQTRRILAACDLPWDARCLTFHDTDRPIRTASAMQVRQPLYQSAVGRSQVYEAYLTPLMAALDT